MITGVSTERWRNGSLRTRYDLAEAGKRCWYAAGAIADIARINETIAMLNRGAAESAPFRACTSGPSPARSSYSSEDNETGSHYLGGTKTRAALPGTNELRTQLPYASAGEALQESTFPRAVATTFPP